MFDYTDMIKRAIEFFPLWTDIRKRTDKSVGGQLIKIAAEKTAEIENSISEYKDFYFLNKYDGIEDSIMAFAFSANIGLHDNIDNIKIKYNKKSISLVESAKDFENNPASCFLENNILYLRKEIVSENNKSIEVFIDGTSFFYEMELTHIWNIFDEYAVFSGIQRKELESNKLLKDRIYFTMRNPGASTEQGLKNSIISELMSTIDINENDIAISQLTPEILRKPYKQYKDLLEYIGSINKEVLKDKQWDIDKWEYDFKSISYLDHKWDSAISSFQNGIGHGDDLNVIIADHEITTNAEITLYEKSLETIENYIQNKDIKKNVSFKLKRYEDVINPIRARYNIKASEMLDITNEDIELSVYDSNNSTSTRSIEEIFEFGKDIEKVDNSKIIDRGLYRLDFYSDKDNELSKIQKADVIYKHNTTGEIVERVNLLKAASGFHVNVHGELINSSIKKRVENLSDFNSYTNLIETDEGIAIGNEGYHGKGIISVKGLAMSNVTIATDIKAHELNKSFISLDEYSYWDTDSKLIFRHDTPLERSFTIKQKANNIKFSILEGVATVFCTNSNGESTSSVISAPNVWEYVGTDIAEELIIKVVSSYEGAVSFGNFEYTAYDFKISTQHGSLIKNNNSYILPNFSNNNLIIDVTEYNPKSISIKSVLFGTGSSDLRYRSEIIPHKDNTHRIFDIVSTGVCDLLTVNNVGNVINRREKYSPSTTYKGISDSSYIRLDLNEYDIIENVISANGKVSLVEESGKIYYNINLLNGQSVDKVTITGTRSVPVKTVTLTDMVKMYFKEYDSTRDRVYANRLCGGLIISNNDPDNPNTFIIKITNEIFDVNAASKYSFTKFPKTLSAAFNSDMSSVSDLTTYNSFNSISFIPSGSRIYNAVNEASIYINEIRGIKILNNFSPILNSSTLMYYEVKPFENDNKVDVKFSSYLDENNSFDTLRNWSVGNKDIAIKTDINLSNTETYLVKELDISTETNLSRYIDLNKSYKISDNNEIFINKYVITPEEDTEVIYELYSETNNEELIKYEELIIEEDGFTKLSHCNIDTLFHLSTSPYSDENIVDINSFTLMKDEGIILWNDVDSRNTKVYIKYSIKQAIALLLDEDDLYKAIGYNVNAYKQIGDVTLTNLKDGDRFDLRSSDEYERSDLIYTKCSSPSFKSESKNDVLIFNKVANESNLLVKTGYYYINGREYYLFPSKDSIEIENFNAVELSNAEISGGEITLHKATNNFVRNSELLHSGINELYDYDYSKDTHLKSSSFANIITACDNFNMWNTFGMKLSIEKGLNDAGIGFYSEIEDGYAYIEITEHLKKDAINFISLWASSKLKIYIGEEDKYLGMNFPHAVNINTVDELEHKNSEFRDFSFYNKSSDKRFYLVVKGDGIIDDILISDSEGHETYHNKNIDLLSLEIDDIVPSGFKKALSLKSNRDIANHGAAFDGEGYISLASKMYWGLTPIFSCNSGEEYSKCYIEGVDVTPTYIKSGFEEGSIETPPIYIDNPSTIQRLIVNVNELDIDSMNGMQIQILSSTNRNSGYTPVNIFNSNKGFVLGKYLFRYIKIKVIIPPNKYLKSFNVYAEYRSDDKDFPKLYNNTSGYALSKVFDLGANVDWKLTSISADGFIDLSEIRLFVQTSVDDYSADVWRSWDEIELDSEGKVKDAIKYLGTRFIRFKIQLTTSSAKIKLKSFNIEVI